MEVKRIDPEEARELLESGEGYTYLDVRSREEFASGHVPGAVNVPLMNRHPSGTGMVPNAEFLEEAQRKFDKEDKIICACLRGGRSVRATHILMTEGFTNIVDMRGGYDGEVDAAGNVTLPGWARRGFPTTTDD